MEKQTTWNLSDLFSSTDDVRLLKAMTEIPKLAARFTKRYRGKIAALQRSPKSLAHAMREYEEIQTRAAKPVVYASLKFAEDAASEKNAVFMQHMHKFSSDIQNQLLFFQHELISLDEKTLRKAAAAPELKNYSHHLTKLIEQKKHILPEEQEILLNESKLNGRSAFRRLFDQEFSKKIFTLKIGGRARKLAESEVLHLLSDPKRAARKAALQALIAGLKEDLWRLTFIFNAVASDKALEDKRRRYKSPESARHLENEVSESSVHTLAEVLRESYPLVQRYYRIKARLLNIKDFSLYDRYAPFDKTKRAYSFLQAQTLLLKSLKQFSPSFEGMARDFFKKRWIDAAKRKGKRGGAFCTYITPDLHPYVFLNFEGSLRDVFTLAHEFGHAIHGCLMRKQTLINFDSPLTIAESASTFAELLLFKAMKKEAKTREELLSLYVHKLDSIFATVHRQISMYLFERDFHAACGNRGALPAAEICSLWQKQQKELYGSAIKLTPDSEVLWSYIPHFLHVPFYVYAYSYGELLALVLYSKYETDKSRFVKSYSEFLALGSSEPPSSSLKKLGIDVERKGVWQQGISIIAAMVDQVEALSKR